MSKIIRVGIMPGRISEIAVEAGSNVADALRIAELDATGYDVKVDGEKVGLDASVDNAELVLLVKQVKGNSAVVRVGIMPGRISEYAVESGTSIAQLLEQADLNATGYDVKVDGEKVTDLDQNVDGAQLVLLVKQVKGNSTVRVGVMPGRISEYAVESGTTIAQLLQHAELDSSGYDVKVDGEKVTDLGASVGGAQLVLLVKQVKGNAEPPME